MTLQKKKPSRRRRGQLLEDALLDAAWVELSASGYADLSMDSVAVRAKTSKTVLYRRWPNRAELVLASLRKHAKVSLDVPDTGTLRGDILAVLRWLSDRHRDFPEILHGLMIELPDAESVSHTSSEMMRAILKRWVDRDEIRAAKVTPRLISLPLDLARYEMFVSRKPLSESAMQEIVDEVVMPLLHAGSRVRKTIRSDSAR